METNEIVVVGVSRQGAKIAVNGENKMVPWRELAQLATHHPDPFRDLDAQATKLFRDLPLADQGIHVVVATRTGGATWYAQVEDATGSMRRDLMRCDEGGDDPQRWLAQQTADEIADRLDCPVRVVELA